MEYRSIPVDREDEFRSIVGYAFSPEGGPPDPDEERPASTLGEPRGLFEDGDLRSVCKHHWFTASIRDDEHPLAGLSAVATPPEHRRQGHVRRLIVESLAEYRDRGSYLSALWPFEHAFYAQFGWATIATYATYECRPSALRVDRERPAGAYTRLEPDDHGRLADVLAAHGERYELTIDRSEAWWRERVFHGREVDPYVYGWTRGGDLRGYVVFQIEEGDDGRMLTVSDTAWIDHEARLACLQFLANHDSQVERVKWYGPGEATFLDIVGDPGDVETTLTAGPMFRLTDLRSALAALSFPPDIDAEIVLRVEDPLVSANDGTFALSIESGSATVDAVDDDPAAIVDVGTLSQLYVGYRPVETLERVGNLSIEEPGAQRLLSRAFPPRTVFLRDRF